MTANSPTKTEVDFANCPVQRAYGNPVQVRFPTAISTRSKALTARSDILLCQHLCHNSLSLALQLICSSRDNLELGKLHYCTVITPSSARARGYCTPVLQVCCDAITPEQHFKRREQCAQSGVRRCGNLAHHAYDLADHEP